MNYYFNFSLQADRGNFIPTGLCEKSHKSRRMKTLLFHYSKLLSFIFAIALLASCSSCNKDCFAVKGKGELVSKSYSTNSFTSIHSAVEAHVFLTQGPVQSIEIKGQQNILDILDVKVDEDELLIGFENHCGSINYDQLQVYITVPTIKAVRISGSGVFDATNTLNVETLSFDISGSARMSATVNATSKIEGNISGSGELYLAGTCPTEKFTISGSGSIFAYGLQSSQSTINVSGSGDAEISVSDHLDVTISGSGNVHYKGQPTINTSISGSGKLHHEN